MYMQAGYMRHNLQSELSFLLMFWWLKKFFRTISLSMRHYHHFAWEGVTKIIIQALMSKFRRMLLN